MADSIDERLDYIEDRLKDMFISGAEAQKLIEEKKRLENIDERYIEAFLAIYKCLERNLNMTRELRYKILSDHRTLDDIKLNKEIEK